MLGCRGTGKGVLIKTSSVIRAGFYQDEVPNEVHTDCVASSSAPWGLRLFIQKWHRKP